MIAVSIVGYKDTGKTTLALALGEELRSRGVSIAAVKFTHHDGVDIEGTDTERLRRVYGSAALLSPDGAALFWEGKRYLPDLLPLLNADVVVVEGGKSLGWLPRILLLRSIADAGSLGEDLALASYGDVEGYKMNHVTDVSALADLVLEKGFALAGLDCGACGRPDCASLARDIVAGKATVKECQSQFSGVEVTVGGNTIAMNPFVQRVFSASLVGMLKEFKGYAPGPIEIKLQGK
ncbi:molybdopterin-guanine dinucleotide biosynthesis protein MobB [Desulfovibrio ferrophilus]|uniref:Molybdopterin-guanine dinucleotide biosynthesis protein n=1 Tax=Desulfovibrio ferrophilus TaxID=241368 RepID=A0A2Z6AW15_9BACT|nr:molybdopterin-guanine dinucleotide biosynthesis protein MobB [Desulfovibrio ferrophilus]BBD07365.1 molybdopterin-guanine dinucleotide biosynthesis protein [Desulfovibrio ferrophilus]